MDLLLRKSKQCTFWMAASKDYVNIGFSLKSNSVRYCAYETAESSSISLQSELWAKLRQISSGKHTAKDGSLSI
jgi:hypothetical protein